MERKNISVGFVSPFYDGYGAHLVNPTVIEMHKKAVQYAITKEKMKNQCKVLSRLFSSSDLEVTASSSVSIWEYIHKEIVNKIELSGGVYSDIHSLNPLVFSIKLNAHEFNISTLLTVYADENRIEIKKELLGFEPLFFAVAKAVLIWIDSELLRQKGYSLKVCKCGVEWSSFLYGSTCGKCLVKNPLLGVNNANT